MRIVKDQIKDKEIKSAERGMLNEWINKMTLDEKIGQLIFTGVRDTVMTEETETLINQYHVGGIILFAHNLETIDQSIRVLNQVKQENEQNKLHLLYVYGREVWLVESMESR